MLDLEFEKRRLNLLLMLLDELEYDDSSPEMILKVEHMYNHMRTVPSKEVSDTDIANDSVPD